MDKLQIALVLGATFLAVRSLVSLMSSHREQYLKSLAAELAAQKREAAASHAASGKADGAKPILPTKPEAAKGNPPPKPGTERTAAPARAAG